MRPRLPQKMIYRDDVCFRVVPESTKYVEEDILIGSFLYYLVSEWLRRNR